MFLHFAWSVVTQLTHKTSQGHIYGFVEERVNVSPPVCACVTLQSIQHTCLADNMLPRSSGDVYVREFMCRLFSVHVNVFAYASFPLTHVTDNHRCLINICNDTSSVSSEEVPFFMDSYKPDTNYEKLPKAKGNGWTLSIIISNMHLEEVIFQVPYHAKLTL